MLIILFFDFKCFWQFLSYHCFYNRARIVCKKSEENLSSFIFYQLSTFILQKPEKLLAIALFVLFISKLLETLARTHKVNTQLADNNDIWSVDSKLSLFPDCPSSKLNKKI